MYKFPVTAGDTYCWDTSPNYNPDSTNNMNTKITLFYDDARLPIIAQQAGGAGALAKVVWRANYTGNVYVMFTREEPLYDPNGTGCGIASHYEEVEGGGVRLVQDSILCTYYCLEKKPDNIHLIWGRKHNYASGCNLNIYDSGLLDGGTYNVRNCYANNEDGYLVVTPPETNYYLRLFGSYSMCPGDTLFIYNGTDTNAFHLMTALTGQGEVPEALAMIAAMGEPFTLRIKTDETCTAEGLDLKIKCCTPLGDLDPESLAGHMVTDNTAHLQWDAAEGTDIIYTWTLYEADGTFIATDRTSSLYAYVNGLQCNTDYYFTLTVYSECLREALDEVFTSNLFRYTHKVKLVGFPRTCYGETTDMQLTITDGLVSSSLTWETQGIEMNDPPTHSYDGVFISDLTVTEDYSVCVTATTPSGCSADTCFYGYVSPIPEPYVLVDGAAPNIDSVTHEICQGDIIQLDGREGYTIRWSHRVGSNNETQNPTFVGPYSTTTYTLTATNSFRCSAEMDFTVIVNMPPVAEITGEEYICYGDTATLHCSGLTDCTWSRVDTLWTYEYEYARIFDTINGNIVFLGYDTTVIVNVIPHYTTTYTTLETGPSDIQVSPSTTTTYAVMGYDSHGCLSIIAEFTLIVRYPPSIVVTPDTSICLGQELPLTATYVPFSGYRWWDETAPEVTLTNLFDLIVHPGAVGDYTYGVEAVSSYGCDTTVRVHVTVHPLPEVTATAIPDTLCARQHAVLTAMGSPAAYSWAPDTVGNPFDISAVKAFCDRHDLFLIEDNCDALGSRFDGKYTGTFGDIGTSSFYPPHHLTMGEGGAVYTNDPLLRKIMLSIRDWGRDCWCPSGKDNTCGCRFTKQFGKLPVGYDHKYVYSHFGCNLKATDMQAAVGCAQLDKLERFTELRTRNFEYLRSRLADLPQLQLMEKLPESDPAWFGFLMTLTGEASFSRNDLAQFLESRLIQTRNLFSGNLTRHPCFEDLEPGRDYRIASELVNTDLIMNRALWVGVYPGMSMEKLEYMAESVIAFCRTKK